MYNIYVRIYVLLPKPSLRPPFVKFIRKSSDLARPQLQTSPSPPRCPPIFLAKIVQIVRIRSPRSQVQMSQFLAREYIFGARLYRERRDAIDCSFFRFFFSLLFSFFFENCRKANESPLGRAVRHGKAIAIHCFLRFFHLFL